MDQDQRDLAGEAIYRFVFRSLYRLQAFNGDPHPGNYLFHGDGRVTFLDFGLVRYFGDAELKVFASMVEAAAIDHDAAAFRRIVEDAGLLRPGRAGADRGGRRLLRALLRARRQDHVATSTPEYASSIVRQMFDRSSPTPSTPPCRGRSCSSSGSTSGCTPCSATSGHRGLPPDGRGAVAVRRCPAVDADGRGRGGVAGRTAGLTVPLGRATDRFPRCPDPALAPLAGSLALVIALVACGGDDDEGRSGPIRPAPTGPAATVPEPVAGAGDDPCPFPPLSIPDSIPTELVVTEITPGTGGPAKDGDTVLVNYVGVRSADGTQFDSNFGGEPIAVTLGTGGVIAGWGPGPRRHHPRASTRAAGHPQRSGLRRGATW